MYTSGKELVEALSKDLGPHMAWTPAEQITLGFIENAADRRLIFDARFNAAAADPDTLPYVLATLSKELRLLDGSIHRWIASLDPNDETQKSQKHVWAANQRWIRTVARSTVGADDGLRDELVAAGATSTRRMCASHSMAVKSSGGMRTMRSIRGLRRWNRARKSCSAAMTCRRDIGWKRQVAATRPTSW